MGINVVRDTAPKFLWGVKFVYVNEPSFETAEPSLDHDIIGPAESSVHALPNDVLASKGEDDLVPREMEGTCLHR